MNVDLKRRCGCWSLNVHADKSNPGMTIVCSKELNLAAKPFAENRVTHVYPSHPALVLLFELIAMTGVCQVISEVGK